MNKSNCYITEVKSLENEYKETIKKIDYKSLTYSNKDYVKIFALGFVSRILENTDAIIILLKNKSAHSPILPLLRNSLEAIIDLDNLSNIDGYLDYLKCLNLKDKLSVVNKNYFKKIHIRNNLDYKSLELKFKKDFSYLIDILKKNYGNTFFNKKKQLESSIYFKFKLSKSLDTYETMYYILCGDTHNNLGSIEKNYINLDMSVSAFKEINLDDLKLICQTSISMLSDLVKIIYIIFDSQG